VILWRVLRTTGRHQDDNAPSVVGATPAGEPYNQRRRRLHLGDERRSMTSPETDVINIVGRSQGRRRNNNTPHTQLSPEVKRRRAGARKYIAVVSVLLNYQMR